MATDYHYTGLVPFVERAARQADAPAAAPGAARQPALLAVDRAAGQLAEMRRAGGQAAIDSPEGFRRAVADVRGYGQAARTELAVALAAADLILAELTERLGLDEPAPTEPETLPPPPPPPAPPAPTDPAPTDPAPTDPAPTDPAPMELMAPEAEAEPAEAPFGPWTGEAEADPGDGTDPGPPGRRHRRRRGEG